MVRVSNDDDGQDMGVITVLDDMAHETIADFLGVGSGGAPGDWEHCLNEGMWGHSGQTSRMDTDLNIDLTVD